MENFTVNAEPRQDFGKNASRRLRRQGKIPAILYGHQIENQAVAVDPKELERILRSEAGHNTIFKISVGDRQQEVLIRDYQLDPVKGTLLHADFQAVAMDELMVFEVPVEILGTPKGVSVGGGVLDFVMREIEIECLPGDVPDHIRVEVADLEIGDAIRVSELTLDAERHRVLSEKDQVVVVVAPPHVEVEEAPEIVPSEEAVEPELIKKGKTEEEEKEEE